MKSVEFCYWLQGYFEIQEEKQGRRAGSLTAMQVNAIKKHLAMVFAHEIDDSYGKDTDKLNRIHRSRPSSGNDGSDSGLIRC